ncbi:SusC/RagA family TonB-linked outer membrane protein [Membranihabitans maritimus]|uniref:SusC/RagA family TonB-linked outer membrane protein n=1 Tax=Membranihabitans maritimus TaxID=2904244 RepID=UPI001F01FE03|nr:SusC/RagA family TonB-linked outer membrane protein [Membranihabitans maritimus]
MKKLHFQAMPLCFVDALPGLKKQFWMRISFVFVSILLSGLQIIMANEGFGQKLEDEIITVDAMDETLQDIFQDIEIQTPFRFAYDPVQVADYKVSISETSIKLDTALKLILKDTPLMFRLIDDKILVYSPSQSRAIKPLEQHRGILSFQKVGLKSYALTLTGKVVSQSGEPLIGVNVLVKGTDKGTATNFEGRFELNDVNENDVLIISYIGYQTTEIPVDGRSSITITLLEDSQTLDEVVVVGYGTQKKVNVIGSVTSVGSEEITASPVGAISNALAGRLPGGIFMQENGEPGNDQANIRIRGNATLGNNSPLVVVDGIPGRDLNSLNPNDIEDITVLKDASAAIYGAQAANGVILVTTKRGKKDVPTKVTYGFYEGALTPTMLPEMADAATYATMIRENQSYRGVDESNMLFSEEDVEKYRSGEYPWTHPNTDWFDAALKDYSSTRQHNLSVTGGGDKISYFGSFGAQNDNGLYTNSNTSYKRYNFRGNVDIEVNEYLDLGLDITGIQENRMYSGVSFSTIFRTIRRMYPTDHAIFPNGLPGPDIEFGEQPMVIPSEETGFDDDKRYRSNNLFSANLKIPWIEGLSLNSYFAYDIYFQKRKLFQKPWTLYSLNEEAYLAAGNTGKEDGSEFLIPSQKGFSEPRVTDYSTNSNSSTFNFKINYSKTLNNLHNLSAFVAYEQQEGFNESFNAYRRYFVSDRLPYLFAGGDEEKDNNGSVGFGARQNYFGRISYNYDETYMFQFSLRRDGSVNFSEEAGRWGNFPSVLVGWRPSQHDWWKNGVSFIDYFKLKASWGQMGNDRVAAFQYLASYGFATGGTFGADKTYFPGLLQQGAPNPNITWEVANVFNFGWESQFLNSKFSFDTDFFYERRNNILVQRNVSVPQFVGITLPDENFGIVENYGFELLLGFNDSKGDFGYGFSGNLAFARNRIIESDEPERPVPWQVRTGKPQGALLLYKSLGIFRDEEHVNSMAHVAGARPGDIIIEDFDGDGEITANDRQLFPLTTTPELTFGLNFNFSYKNWELSGLIQGHGRALRRVYNDLRAGTAGNYFQYDAEDRWTPDNIDGTKPRAYQWTEEYWRSSHITDFNYSDVSYARLRNLKLNYRLPASVMDFIGIQSARIYASGQNLWLIYSGNDIMDPELFGMQSYPIMKVISVGAQISF